MSPQSSRAVDKPATKVKKHLLITLKNKDLKACNQYISLLQLRKTWESYSKLHIIGLGGRRGCHKALANCKREYSFFDIKNSRPSHTGVLVRPLPSVSSANPDSPSVTEVNSRPSVEGYS